MKTNRLFPLLAAMLVALTCYAPPLPPSINARVLTPYITTLNFGSLGNISGTDQLPDNSGVGIKLASLQHSVTMPINSTGHPTGTRKHAPLTVVKQLDEATPILYKALAQQAQATVVIRFYGSMTNGVATNFFTYTLNNAQVVAIRNWQPNANDPAAAPFAHPEEVSFCYDAIEWEHNLTGTVYQDDNISTPP